MAIKPGKRDIKVSMLITGTELTSLQTLTVYMAESFGLDSRIIAYRGKRPIGLYQWDLDCLIMAVEYGIQDIKDQKKWIFGECDAESLGRLLSRLKQEYDTHYGDDR